MAEPEEYQEARWYAIYCNAQAEGVANHLLKQAGYETLFLHYRDTSRHARREIPVTRSYFTRYLFVAVGPSQSVYRVNKTQGVSTVVYAGEEPLEVPEQVIEELKGRGDKNGLVEIPAEQKELRKRLQKGDRIRFDQGAFTGLFGTVIIDSGPMVKLWVEGKLVKARSEHLSPAGAAR